MSAPNIFADEIQAVQKTPQADNVFAQEIAAVSPFAGASASGGLESTNSILGEFQSAFPKGRKEQFADRNIAGTNTKSKHATGEAGDLYDPDLNKVHKWALNNPKIGMVIYNRQIWQRDSKGEWKSKKYTGVNPHDTHIHVEPIKASQNPILNAAKPKTQPAPKVPKGQNIFDVIELADKMGKAEAAAKTRKEIEYLETIPGPGRGTGLENIPLPRGEESAIQRSNTAFSGSTRTRYGDTPEGKAFTARMEGIASIVGLPRSFEPSELGLSLLSIIPGVAAVKSAGAIGRGLAKVPGLSKITKALSTAKTEAQFAKALEGLDTLPAAEQAYIRDYIESQGGKMTSPDQIPFENKPRPQAKFNPVTASVKGSKGYDPGEVPDLKAMGATPNKVEAKRIDAGIPITAKKTATPKAEIPVIEKPKVIPAPKAETPKPPRKFAEPPKTELLDEPSMGVSKASRTIHANQGLREKPVVIHGKTLEQAEAGGKKLLDEDGVDAMALSRKLAEDGRAPTADEWGAISVHSDRLIGKRVQIQKQLDDLNLSGHDRKRLLQEQGDLDDEIREFDRYIDENKAAASSSLNSLKIGQRVNWKDVDEVLNEATRLKGGTLYKGQRESIEKMVAEEADAEKAIITEADKTEALEEIISKTSRSRPRNIEQVRLEKNNVKQAIKDALKGIKQEQSSSLNPFSTISGIPEAIRQVKNLIALTVEERGLKKLDADFYKAVREEFDSLGLGIEITDKDIRRTFSGYYGRVKRNIPDSKRELADLRRQASLMSQIEDAQLGFPKSQRIKPKPSDEVRILQEKLKEVLKLQRGDSDKIGKLRELIEEAKDMLATGRRKPKTEQIDSAQVAELKGKLKELRKEMGLEDRIKAIEDDLKTLQEGGTIVPKEKATAATNPRIEDLEYILKQKRAKLKAAVKAMEGETLPKMFEGFGRNMQLINVASRVVDLTSNTGRLASYIVGNPLRSILSAAAPSVQGKERVLGMRSLFDTRQGKQVLRDLKDVWKGLDEDTLEKYGKSGGFGTKLAGTTDVVFKNIYTRLAFDDVATDFAKRLGQESNVNLGRVSDTRMEVYSQLMYGAKGPMTNAEVRAAKVLAHDWALRNTYNIDNVASMGIDGAKIGMGHVVKRFKGTPQEKSAKVVADSFVTLIDMNARFTKVLTNVALDKVNRTAGIGTVEALGRLFTQFERQGWKISREALDPKELRLIADLAEKGMSGLALYYLGKHIYDQTDNGEIVWEYPAIRESFEKGSYQEHKVTIMKPKILQTEGGTRFIQWEFMPGVLGGIDGQQLGAYMGPILEGMTAKFIEKSDLTEKQKAALWNKYLASELTSTPLASNLKQSIDSLENFSPGKYIGGLAARNLIPGLVSDVAARQDKLQTGTELRKSKDFWDEFIKRFPKMPEHWMKVGLVNASLNVRGKEYGPYHRQTLPSNQKQPN